MIQTYQYPLLKSDKLILSGKPYQINRFLEQGEAELSDLVKRAPICGGWVYFQYSNDWFNVWHQDEFGSVRRHDLKIPKSIKLIHEYELYPIKKELDLIESDVLLNELKDASHSEKEIARSILSVREALNATIPSRETIERYYLEYQRLRGTIIEFRTVSQYGITSFRFEHDSNPSELFELYEHIRKELIQSAIDSDDEKNDLIKSVSGALNDALKFNLKLLVKSKEHWHSFINS